MFVPGLESRSEIDSVSRAGGWQNEKGEAKMGLFGVAQKRYENNAMVASASVSSSPGKQGKCLSHCPIGLLERYADDVDVENNRQMASSAGPRLPMRTSVICWHACVKQFPYIIPLGQVIRARTERWA